MAKSSVSDTRKRRIGRPPVNAVAVMVRYPPAELAPIDDWIARQREPVSRPEAIRRLAAMGLEKSAKIR
jgi:hypothetical protein